MSDPNTPSPPAPPAPAPTPPAPPPGPAIAWLPDADTDTVGYIQNKGWAGADAAIKGYRDLERFVGADKAGRGLVLPKDDDPAEAWAPVWDRLGRPANADGYKLHVPDGQSPDFAKAAAGWMHEAGIPAKAGQALAGKWNEFIAAQQKAAEVAEESAFAAEDAALNRDWGSEKTARMEIARRTAKELGMTDAAIGALEKAAGFSGVMKTFAKIGDALFKEAGLAGDQRPGAFGMTPEGAKARKGQLMADAEWRKKAMNPQSSEWAEMIKLDKLITGAT